MRCVKIINGRIGCVVARHAGRTQLLARESLDGWQSREPIPGWARKPVRSVAQKRFEHNGMVPPNNWESLFGGAAWEWVPARKQFYYHKFYKQQPNLNWTEPAVESAMFDIMRFWLDRGVAGFRLDAIPTLFEDPKLRNKPETPGINAQGDPNLDHIYTDNLPEVHAPQTHQRSLLVRIK